MSQPRPMMSQLLKKRGLPLSIWQLNNYFFKISSMSKNMGNGYFGVSNGHIYTSNYFWVYKGKEFKWGSKRKEKKKEVYLREYSNPILQDIQFTEKERTIKTLIIRATN